MVTDEQKREAEAYRKKILDTVQQRKRKRKGKTNFLLMIDQAEDEDLLRHIGKKEFLLVDEEANTFASNIRGLNFVIEDDDQGNIRILEVAGVPLTEPIDLLQ